MSKDHFKLIKYIPKNIDFRRLFFIKREACPNPNPHQPLEVSQKTQVHIGLSVWTLTFTRIHSSRNFASQIEPTLLGTLFKLARQNSRGASAPKNKN